MTRTPATAVSISAGDHQSPLSKGQKAFNSLIKQIEKKRTLLAAWEEAIPPYQRKYTSELVPLIADTMNLQIKLVHFLDHASTQKGLTKHERQKISEVITGLAGELAAARDDADLKALYNKHSRSDFDVEAAADLQGMKTMLEYELGFELGDDLGLSSPEEILARARILIEEQAAQEDANRLAWEAARQAKRTKSTKQLAKEAQQQAEAQALRQSIREIYRKLASVLHPDRETDPQERERKTALMQRVNQAYDKNNLLQLLELQLELEHIDQATIANISEDRLKHYNKILREQVLDLEMEIRRVEDRFRAQFGIDPFARISLNSIMNNLAVEIVNIESTIRQLQKDLREFDDTKKFKAWLRALWRPARHPDDFDAW